MYRYMQPLRVAIQWTFLLFQVYLGIQFYRFTSAVLSGTTPKVARPDAIEGFLPLSGLLGLKDWLYQGVINPVHPAAVIIFLTVLTVSLLLKRSFCSWICPVGTISEVLWKWGFSLFRRNVHPVPWVDRGLRAIKYLLLFFFVYTILWAMTPEQVTEFVHSNYNKSADIRLLLFFLNLSGAGMFVMGVLLLASLPLRNPLCRYFCPYGALLGLLSMASPVKVTRRREICVSCGACSQVCPASIPVMHREKVHSEECIGCWRCISHCRATGALQMGVMGTTVVVNGLVFACLVVGLFWAGSIIGKATGHWRSNVTPETSIRLMQRLN